MVSDIARVRRLRRLLIVFFILLMLPVGALLYFGFQQMKWEVYHQYREQAEALVARINLQLGNLLEQENLRPSTDYRFLSTEEQDGQFRLTRSPLSKLPDSFGIAGLVGYFQIDQEGEFTTPLLPSRSLPRDEHRLSEEQLGIRREISSEIRNILVSEAATKAHERQDSTASAESAPSSDGDTQDDSESLQSSLAQLEKKMLAPGAIQSEGTRLRKDSIAQFDVQPEQAYQTNRQRLGSVAELELDDRLAQKAEQGFTDNKSLNDKADLNFAARENRRRKEKTTSYAPAASAAAPEKRVYAREQIDQSSATRSGGVASAPAPTANIRPFDAPPPASVDVIEEQARVAPNELVSETIVSNAQKPSSGGALDPRPVTIRTFETEIEDLRLSLFDDEHLIVHRNVWQNGSRFIQGLVINRDRFIRQYVQSAFYNTPLASMSQLVVALNDDVLNIFTAPDKYRYRYSPASTALKGSVLFQRNLIEPLGGFSLIFNITDLPTGKSIKYLAWVTAIMLAVMLAGFTIIYRYSKRQISLLRQQQDFVSAVSHELKTPLTSIRMYSEMLKNGWASEDKRKGYYEYIHSESERLSRLIENVLQLARINRKQTRLSITTVSVNELLSNVLSTISSVAQAADFEIENNAEQDALDCFVETSSDAAMQIIINIADNAIKFSRNAEIKKVSMRANLLSDGSIELGIRDYGPGIDQSQLKKIFELFYRSENELTRETVGTGIGLALVHELARSLGIIIDIRHCEPGVEFTIKWPAALVSRRGENR